MTPLPRKIGFEHWCAWFSPAVFCGDLPEILSLYESQPKGAFEQWKQQHACPDWLEQTIDRWEAWKAKQGGVAPP